MGMPVRLALVFAFLSAILASAAGLTGASREDLSDHSSLVGAGVRWDQDSSLYAARPASVSFLPKCSTDCAVGEESFGYLYSALYDRALQEVHIFLEIKHPNASHPNSTQLEGSPLVDACVFTFADGQLHHRTQAIARTMWDVHLYYSSARIICPVVMPFAAKQPLWVGPALAGKAYPFRIPVTEVPQEQRAQVGVCVATMFDWIDASNQTKEWLQYTRSLGVDGRFHMYLTRQEIKFDEERGQKLAWWRPRKAEPSHDIPGVDWVHVDAFNWTHTWVSGQLVHYAHCMFYHRHVYRYILLWDTDEFLVLKQPGISLPALLDRAAAQHPTAAAIAFHRFAYRAGCLPMQRNLTRNHSRIHSNSNSSSTSNSKALVSLRLGAGAVANASHVREHDLDAPWHAAYDAREHMTESDRSVIIRGWHNIEGRGDKLAVRPLLVDDVFIHFVHIARTGYSDVSATPTMKQAYLKHVRRHKGADDCANMTFAEPGHHDASLETALLQPQLQPPPREAAI